jgi:hypothetical protein
MFSQNYSLAQSFRKWGPNLTNVIEASATFEYCSVLDCAFDTWDIRSIEDDIDAEGFGSMAHFLRDSGLSIDNTNKTLIGWAHLAKKLLNSGDGFVNAPEGIILGMEGLEVDDTVYTRTTDNTSDAVPGNQVYTHGEPIDPAINTGAKAYRYLTDSANFVAGHEAFTIMGLTVPEV